MKTKRKQLVIDQTQQQGIAIPLIAIAMLALMAVAGLSMDGSHTLANKTRLQNTVDSAALAAAKIVKDTDGDIVAATTEANTVLGRNSDGLGNHEMDIAYDAGDIDITIEFSAGLNPFVPGSPNGPFVRVIAENFDVGTTLSRVLGINEIPVRASAVSGPSPTIKNACDVAPILVCAEDVTADNYGFEDDRLMVLKPMPGDHEDVGPGNYKLLDLGCPDSGGGACIRENLAGGYRGCIDELQTVETKPGETAGPTEQGFNTRFGEYGGGGPDYNAQNFPPDVVVDNVLPAPELTTQSCNGGSPPGCSEDTILQGATEVEYGADLSSATSWPADYTGYQAASSPTTGAHDYSPEGTPAGAYGRRVMALPVTDCTGADSGQSTLTVYGFACYFMLQPVAGGADKNIFGVFVDDCDSGGSPGSDPDAGPGPTIIQLYKDTDSGDS